MTQLELPFGAAADENPCGSETAAKRVLVASECLEGEQAARVLEDDPGAPGKHNDDDTTEPVQIAVPLPTGAATKPAKATTIAEAAHLDHPVLHFARKPETLDDAIAALRESGQVDTKLLKRLASDVRMATKLVHRTMATENARPPSLPCAPAKLRDYLAQVLPARHPDDGQTVVVHHLLGGDGPEVDGVARPEHRTARAALAGVAGGRGHDRHPTAACVDCSTRPILRAAEHPPGGCQRGDA